MIVLNFKARTRALTLALLALGACTGVTSATVKQEHVHDACQQNNACPDGQSCVVLLDEGARCVDTQASGDYCALVDCGSQGTCSIQESFPPRVWCR